MRRRYAAGKALIMAFAVLAGSLSGCGAKAESSDTVQVQGSPENGGSEPDGRKDEEKQEENAPGSLQEGRESSSAGNGSAAEMPVVEDGRITVGGSQVSLDLEDEYTPWEESAAVKIGLDEGNITIEGQGAQAEGSTVTIEKGGTYVLRGTLSDGAVFVDAGADDIVRLILDGVNIHSETWAAVEVKEAGKTIISLEEGTSNTLSSGSGQDDQDNGEEKPGGALFGSGALTINGSGELKVEAGLGNGISSKDILKLVGGRLEITAAKHGLRGKDALAVYDGQAKITTTENGMKSDGLAVIFGGEIVVSDCEEGLEGEDVVICGGSLDITSRDDGINASTDEENTPQIYILGGTVTVNAEGDGIDSNGSIHMSGGEVTVYGPSERDNGALDYDGTFELTGGLLAAFGPGGMEQNVTRADSQVSVLVDFQETQAAGTTVTLLDKEGNEWYKGTGEKDFRTVVLSVPEMAVGSEYVVEAGENAISFTPEETIIYVNKEGIQEAASMGPGRGDPGNGRGGRKPEPPEGWEEGEKPKPPEGRKDGGRAEPPEGREEGERMKPSEGR